MDIKFIVYYILLVSAAITGTFVFNKKKYLRPLIFLLPISILVEAIVEYKIHHRQNYYFIYHAYEIIDFAFFCFLFYKNTANRILKKSIAYFFIAYLLLIIYITLSYSGLNTYPALQYSLESFFLILICVIFLFNIPADQGEKITGNNMFWISIGLIICHSGVLVVNGSYNYLLSLSKNALEIKNWINMIFNYFLYISFLIAFLWPQKVNN